MLATRVKLGGTQDVAALIELSNGEFLIASQSVKVTIGGCGWSPTKYKRKNKKDLLWEKFNH